MTIIVVRRSSYSNNNGRCGGNAGKWGKEDNGDKDGEISITETRTGTTFLYITGPQLRSALKNVTLEGERIFVFVSID